MVNLAPTSKFELYDALKKIVDAQREAKESQHVITDVLLKEALDEAESLIDRILVEDVDEST